MCDKMSDEIDIQEVKEAVALHLVNLLTGFHREELMQLLPPDEREIAECQCADILDNMAAPMSGPAYPSYWVFMLDIAFDRDPQFSKPVFKMLASSQNTRIAAAAKYMADSQEKLEKDKREKGLTENLQHSGDDEAKKNRAFLEERLEMTVLGLKFAVQVGVVMDDIVCALSETGNLVGSRLWQLGFPEDWEH